jgi:hypothetical protein
MAADLVALGIRLGWAAGREAAHRMRLPAGTAPAALRISIISQLTVMASAPSSNGTSASHR